MEKTFNKIKDETTTFYTFHFPKLVGIFYNSCLIICHTSWRKKWSCLLIRGSCQRVLSHSYAVTQILFIQCELWREKLTLANTSTCIKASPMTVLLPSMKVNPRKLSLSTIKKRHSSLRSNRQQGFILIHMKKICAWISYS